MSELAKEAADFIREAKRLAAQSQPEKVMEKRLGRKLEDYETVIKVGDEYLLGFKAGVPYQYLTCRHCGNRVIDLQYPDKSEAAED